MEKGQYLTLNKDYSYQTSNEVGTIPKGGQVKVEQLDCYNKKILIEVGIRRYVWVGVETLQNLTTHN